MPIRILYLVPCQPAGKAFGTRLRVRQIGSALQTLGTVDTIVVTDDDRETPASDGDTLLPVLRVVTLRRVANRSASERLRCGFDPTYIGHHGRYADPSDRQTLLADLPNYDLVWIYQLNTADVFGLWRWDRSVLDFNDIPSAVLHRERRRGQPIAQRMRAGLRLPVARRRERLAEARFTTLCVCSAADQHYLHATRAVHVIPNGFPAPAHVPAHAPVTPPRVGFLGTFDYAPNVDGIRWFLQHCWPGVRRASPDVRLRLVGAGCDRADVLPADAPGVEAIGWLDDVTAEVATWSVMIVPLRLGGGTRVKIAEALSRKCPIVSTTFGAYGYAGADGREMLLADSAGAFAGACIEAIGHPNDARAMAERGWRTFLDHWTWDAIQPRVIAAAEDCLRREPRP